VEENTHKKDKDKDEGNIEEEEKNSYVFHLKGA
jgi:hypothetical protein